MSNTTLTILSIDDKMLTSELDRAGYRKIGINIRSAGNFNEADKLLSSENIDAVIINDDFKEINGLALLKHYKGQDATKDIPFIFTSVRSKPHHYKALVEAGLDLFIEQPVPRSYFVEKLRELLDQKTRDNLRVGFSSNLEFEKNGKSYQAEMRDISPTGLLLVHKDRLAINDTIQMNFILPTYKRPIRVRGVIIRDMKHSETYEGFAYGVKFEKFEGDSQKRLQSYIEKNHPVDPKMVYYL